jgi:hypothetical protein
MLPEIGWGFACGAREGRRTRSFYSGGNATCGSGKMKPGDRVDVRYGNGKVEAGAILSIEADLVIIRVTTRIGTIMVAPDRLIGEAPGCWRLEF